MREFSQTAAHHVNCWVTVWQTFPNPGCPELDPCQRWAQICTSRKFTYCIDHVTDRFFKAYSSSSLILQWHPRRPFIIWFISQPPWSADSNRFQLGGPFGGREPWTLLDLQPSKQYVFCMTSWVLRLLTVSTRCRPSDTNWHTPRWCPLGHIWLFCQLFRIFGWRPTQ